MENKERIYRFNRTDKCPCLIGEDYRCGYNPDDVTDCAGIESDKCPLEYAPIAEELIVQIHDEWATNPKGANDRHLSKYHVLELIFPNARFKVKK